MENDDRGACYKDLEETSRANMANYLWDMTSKHLGHHLTYLECNLKSKRSQKGKRNSLSWSVTGLLFTLCAEWSPAAGLLPKPEHVADHRAGRTWRASIATHTRATLQFSLFLATFICKCLGLLHQCVCLAVNKYCCNLNVFIRGSGFEAETSTIDTEAL